MPGQFGYAVFGPAGMGGLLLASLEIHKKVRVPSNDEPALFVTPRRRHRRFFFFPRPKAIEPVRVESRLLALARGPWMDTVQQCLCP